MGGACELIFQPRFAVVRIRLGRFDRPIFLDFVMIHEERAAADKENQKYEQVPKHILLFGNAEVRELHQTEYRKSILQHDHGYQYPNYMGL